MFGNTVSYGGSYGGSTVYSGQGVYGGQSAYGGSAGYGGGGMVVGSNGGMMGGGGYEQGGVVVGPNGGVMGGGVGNTGGVVVGPGGNMIAANDRRGGMVVQGPNAGTAACCGSSSNVVVSPVPPPPGDGCGCGPGSNAGECAGSCGGAESMCCDAQGSVTSAQWVYVSGGSYAPCTSYNYVGQGCGSYEREFVTTYYGWKCRKCCLALLGLLMLLGLLWLLMNLLNPDVGGEETIPDEPTIEPQPQPAKTCLVFGDPHLLTFDGQRADYYTPGEYWIVRSDTVWIQGMYRGTKMTGTLAVTTEVGISGPFIQNHKLIVGTSEITWDGAVIQSGFDQLGATWRSANPPILMDYNGQGTTMQKSRQGKQLHVVHLTMPNGVNIEVNRWDEAGESPYINIRITMPPQPNQDGHCGNFNGNVADDDRVKVRARVGKTGVPQEQLIFPITKTPINPSGRPDLNDCPKDALSAAVVACRKDEGKFFPSQGCLIDACLGHMVPEE